jgi:hypothetical protein
MKTCPYCEQEIQSAAAVCNQCGGLLYGSKQSSEFRSTISDRRIDKRVQALGILLTAIGTLLMWAPFETGSRAGRAGYFGMAVMLLGLVLWGFGKFNQWSHSK